MLSVVWDERKRQANLRAHRLDFADVERGFDFSAAMLETSYGGRLLATGVLRDKLVTLVFKPLGSQGIALISLRPASRKERERYEDA